MKMDVTGLVSSVGAKKKRRRRRRKKTNAATKEVKFYNFQHRRLSNNLREVTQWTCIFFGQLSNSRRTQCPL